MKYFYKDSNQAYLMLQDTTKDGAPRHVQQLLEHFQSPIPLDAELLFLLLYTLALEAGFVAREEFEKCRNTLQEVAPSAIFHAGNLREISRFKPSYSGQTGQFFNMSIRSLLKIMEAEEDKLTNWLSATVVENRLIVSLSAKIRQCLPGFSLCLHIKRYVRAEQNNSDPIYSRFQNLEELNRIVRDEMLVPRLQQLYTIYNFNISPSLEGLPFNVYDEIFQHLSCSNIMKLTQVSRTLYSTGRASKKLCMNRIPYSSLNSVNFEQQDYKLTKDTLQFDADIDKANAEDAEVV